jgi:hypothetical protein
MFILTTKQLESKAMNSEKVLVKNDVQILSSTVLNSGSTLYSFEIPLPADLPETVKCEQINVEYNIISKINYNSKYHEEIEKKVTLARLPEEHFNIDDSEQQQLKNWCKYRIKIDKHSIALGSRLPIEVDITPFISGLRLKQIFVQLIERRTVNSNTNQLCHFLYPTKNNITLPQLPLTKNWKNTFYYEIPKDKVSHSTNEYDDFNIKHVLLVSLIVSCPDGNRRYNDKTISFQTQIDLLDSQLIHCEPSIKLPPYDYPISLEEIDKLNRHGLLVVPPSYEESTLITA